MERSARSKLAAQGTFYELLHAKRIENEIT